MAGQSIAADLAQMPHLLIDTMEEEGIIGPPTGTSKARKVMPFEDEEKGEAPENGENRL